MDPELQKNLRVLRDKGYTDDQIRAYASQWQAEHATPAPAPSEDTALSAKNLGRAALQGGTFNFGDELGIVDQKKEDAFKLAHPVADFLSRLGGGIVAPAIAIGAGPEALAGAGGAALLGGATGALSGAGEGTDAKSRLEGAAVGAPVGAASGLAGYGAAKALGGIAQAVMMRVAPEFMAKRAVGQMASEVLSPAEATAAQARMNAANAIAPGSSSPASAAVPPVGEDASRFLNLVRATGNSPKAGATAEQQVTGQLAANKAGQHALGAQMDALDEQIPVTPRWRDAFALARDILGPKKVPPLEPESQGPMSLFSDGPQGVQLKLPAKAGQAAPVSGSLEPDEQQTLRIQDARDILNRLRTRIRNFSQNGAGADLQDLVKAKNAIQDVLYDPAEGSPRFRALDQQYAKLKAEESSAEELLKQVQPSRRTVSANTAMGIGSKSLGGQLTKDPAGAVQRILDALLTNKAAVADATARMVTRPGASIADLLAAAPRPTSRMVIAGRGGLLSSLEPAVADYLRSQQDQQQP